MLPLLHGRGARLLQHGGGARLVQPRLLMPSSPVPKTSSAVCGILLSRIYVAANQSPAAAAVEAAANARHFATSSFCGLRRRPSSAVGQRWMHSGVFTREFTYKNPASFRGAGSVHKSWQLLNGGLVPPAAAAMLLPRCSFVAGAAGRHSAMTGASSAAADDKRRSALALAQQSHQDAGGGMLRRPVSSKCRLPLPDKEDPATDRLLGALGVGILHPQRALKFAATFVLNFRFYFMYMARTTFQAVRPLLAFCVFGEVMKLVLATMSSGLFSFLFSFVLAFEVLYFFLQCYISYTFLTMFFTVLF